MTALKFDGQGGKGHQSMGSAGTVAAMNLWTRASSDPISPFDSGYLDKYSSRKLESD